MTKRTPDVLLDAAIMWPTIKSSCLRPLRTDPPLGGVRRHVVANDQSARRKISQSPKTSQPNIFVSGMFSGKLVEASIFFNGSSMS